MNLRALLCGTLSAALIVVTTPVQAAMIDNTEIIAQQASDARQSEVQAFMARDDVRAQLEALGVDPALATQRAAALTGNELQGLAQNIEAVPAGGDVGLGIILLIVLILLLL